MNVFQPTVILDEAKVSIHPTARVDSFCKIEGGLGVVIGLNVHVASFCHINAGGGAVHLRDHCGLASHVIVCGGVVELAGQFVVTPMDKALAERRLTVVGEYALINAGAILLPGVEIGRGAVIGAGSLVAHNVPPGEIWFGRPAVFVKRREGL